MTIKEIMSDAQHQHQSLIQTPKQLVVAVAGFFLVVVLGIILLVSFVTNVPVTGAGTDSQDPKAIAARLQPVAAAGFTLIDANAPRVLQAGAAVYAATCAACHDSGMAGAPKMGDSGSWGARLAQGYDTLLKHAIEGIRAMPAKGGNPDLDPVEVARAVVFMTNKSGASFKEPEVAATNTPPKTADVATPDTQDSQPATPAVAPANVAPPAAPATSVATAAPATASIDGKKVYDGACVVCHGAGVAGAPKLGDKAAWGARIAQGNSTLYEHAIKGFQGKVGVMPAKGGAAVSDAEVKAAVDFMVIAGK